MASLRATSRMQVGSAPWISEERNCALHIAEAEAEEFTFSARNELDWLNEHMAEIFNENQLTVTEIFKTPGKLRGKTPRTARKRDVLEARAPLTELFSATPKAAQSPFREKKGDRQGPRFKVAEDVVQPPLQIAPAQKPVSRVPNKAFNDSGYHGSQASVTTLMTEVSERNESQIVTASSQAKVQLPTWNDSASEGRRTTEESFQSAKEDQTIAVVNEDSTIIQENFIQVLVPRQLSPQAASVQTKRDAVEAIPSRNMPLEQTHQDEGENSHAEDNLKNIANDALDIQSPSEDGSSPVRAPLVRKSSLTFASLPAREPLTKQSIGMRTSQATHFDQSRTSHFGRQTGGKSIGNTQREDYRDQDGEMDIDRAGENDITKEESDNESKLRRMHNKTSTQRLQDQISMLGQSQSQVARPSKSIPNMAAIVSQSSNMSQLQEPSQATLPTRTERAFAAPGAFPEDEEDDWIGPPNVANNAPSVFSPRPVLTKGYSADAREGIHGKDTVTRTEFIVPKQRRDEPSQRSPVREPVIPERTTSTLGYTKSASTSILQSPTKQSDIAESLLKKSISVSNPNLASAVEDANYPSAPKSPTRSFRDSPLKAAKDKVSSILKTSRNLFVSSAAASAAAKNSTFSPPPTRLGYHESPSVESVLQHEAVNTSSVYPSLENLQRNQDQSRIDSPSRFFAHGKVGSVPGGEDKKKEKEAKEAREAQKRDEKLEKLREKESEKARLFNQQEQERVAVMERQIMAKKEQETAARAAQTEAPRATRSSPRKPKLDAESAAADAVPVVPSKDFEMTDASTMPPPEVPRPTTANPRDQIKRPVKPAKENTQPAKQAPVVIRVDTGSQRNPQRNIFHPSNTSLANSLSDSLAPPTQATRPTGPPPAIRNKANTASVRPKVSTSSIKSVSSTNGKVKALEAAAKKKEQEEQEAQRKRANKLDMDRKRAAMQEGKQQEQKRQNEADRLHAKQPDPAADQMDPRKTNLLTAEKKLEIERAKQQKPPAPAPRPQPLMELAQTNLQDKHMPSTSTYRGELGQTRPASRMESVTQQPDNEFGKSMSSTFQNTAKAPPKRPLPQDATEDSQSRPVLQRNGPSNHGPEPKRRKTIDDDDEEMAGNPTKGHMAPPVRQSSMRPKDVPTKSLFPNGYANAAQPSHVAASLHKATTNTQHMHKVKPAHPMDMAQNSKAPITFAPNPAQIAVPPHKTPARPAGAVANGVKSNGKPAPKSSPRYQNGDSIDLPEIPTDSEDEDSDDDAANNFPIPNWANSPALNQGLILQEGMDPVSVFGLPGEIKLEEVFKNAERHPRFRARTSSANWNGSDRLTEDEVKRDLEARDRLRREGGWSYGLS